MKKIMLVAIAASLFLANAAMADSIAGKVGVAVRGGASYIFDSEFTSSGSGLLGGVKEDIKADIGWTGGAGIMYGITDNLSVNFDVIYFQTDLEMSSAYGAWDEKFGKGKTVDFALGAQWRFMPKSAFVPYVGAGLDFLWNKMDPNESPLAWATGNSFDVDPTYGAHLSVGGDYFLTPNIALHAEIRGLYSTKGDMTYKYPGDTDFVAAKYNPSNISGFVGIAFYFGGKKEEPAPTPVQDIKKETKAAPVVEQQILEKGRAELKVEFDSGQA